MRVKQFQAITGPREKIMNTNESDNRGSACIALLSDDYERMSPDQKIQYLLDGWLASAMKCNKALTLLQESRKPDKSVNVNVCLCPESYEWMAEKVREHSDMPSDYMAAAAHEFEKVAEAMKVLVG